MHVRGYVALLDALGFSAMVAADPDGERLQAYLALLRAALGEDTDGLGVDYLVFSDSIVITTRDDSDESLKTLARKCSTIFSNRHSMKSANRSGGEIEKADCTLFLYSTFGFNVGLQ